MKKKIMMSAASLLVLALLVWAFMPRPKEVEIATVTLGRFERTVQENGKTRLRAEQVARIGVTQASVAKLQANLARAKVAFDEAKLGNTTRLEVVVDFLAEDAAQIKPGSAAQLSNWGGPDVLLGQVRRIEPAAFTKVSALGVEEQRVNTIIDITSAPEKWRALGDGFKVDVRVLVQVEENAVKVPVSALFPVGARSALFVFDKGRARLKEIKVAIRNGIEAWVQSDLAPGTQVIVYPDSKLRNGEKVKTR